MRVVFILSDQSTASGPPNGRTKNFAISRLLLPVLDMNIIEV
jgi:hypothetical protein